MIDQIYFGIGQKKQKKGGKENDQEAQTQRPTHSQTLGTDQNPKTGRQAFQLYQRNN